MVTRERHRVRHTWHLGVLAQPEEMPHVCAHVGGDPCRNLTDLL